MYPILFKHRQANPALNRAAITSAPSKCLKTPHRQKSLSRCYRKPYKNYGPLAGIGKRRKMRQYAISRAAWRMDIRLDHCLSGCAFGQTTTSRCFGKRAWTASFWACSRSFRFVIWGWNRTRGLHLTAETHRPCKMETQAPPHRDTRPIEHPRRT